MKQTERTSDVADLRLRVHELMPGLHDVLKRLVRIRSVSAVPTPPAVISCCDAIVHALREAGISSARRDTIRHIGQQTAPLVFADQPSADADAPTVLLYAHYDVQPAVRFDGWSREPFQPWEKPGQGGTRLVGRGSADDKSGICMHLGAVQAFGGSPPVHLKFVFEGEKELGRGVLEDYLTDPSTQDERFAADVIVVADSGNVGVGIPTLTSTLRGICVFDVTVETLHLPAHSGMFGGLAPDAFMALARLISTLHDDAGNVAVAGLVHDDDFPWVPVDHVRFRTDAHVRCGVPLIGSGTRAQRLFGRPSINVIGLDGVKPMDEATDALCAQATARISVRLAPTQDPAQAKELLQRHLEGVQLWGIEPTVTFVSAGAGFLADQDGPYNRLAGEAIAEAYQEDATVQTGQGGSNPLVRAFSKVNPDADIVLWGCTEPKSAIHGVNESVSYAELERMTLAEAILLRKIANRGTTTVAPNRRERR